MSRTLTTLATVSLAVLVPTGALAAATPTPAPKLATTLSTAVTSSTCSVTWGSLPKGSSRSSSAVLTGVRSGQHACYDRLVIDLRGPIVGYDVRYVDTVRADGSGTPIPLRGGARLAVVVLVPAYDSAGQPTYRPVNVRELTNVTGYRTFRQVAWAGSFEGRTTVGLGVRARLPFRVFTLAGPGDGSRLVIDVAHTW